MPAHMQFLPFHEPFPTPLTPRDIHNTVKGVAHWSVSNDQSLLFDAAASKLPLLDLTNTRVT